MLYSYIVEQEIRKTFDHVNNHRWELSAIAFANGPSPCSSSSCWRPQAPTPFSCSDGRRIPSFIIKTLTVTTVWPGATAREMQDLVAEPLEKRIQELTW